MGRGDEMLWNRAKVRRVHIPAQSTSPDALLGVRRANLIDVRAMRHGRWRAICECGDNPETFADEFAAWHWIIEHRCPVLDVGAVPPQRPRTAGD